MAGAPASGVHRRRGLASGRPGTTPVYSPFQGKTELVELNVKVGDRSPRGRWWPRWRP